MKIKVYQSETDSYLEMDLLGKLRYIGKSFGVDGLTNNKIYDCVGIDGGMFRIVDDSDEDYLYPINQPKAGYDHEYGGGRWEIVEVYDEKMKEALDRYVK